MPACQPKRSTPSRPTAPAPRSATRSRRGRCSRPTAKIAKTVRSARLDQIQHRPPSGRRRGGGCDQDGEAMQQAFCQRACTSTSQPRTSTGLPARSRCCTTPAPAARQTTRAALGCLRLASLAPRARDLGAGTRPRRPRPYGGRLRSSADRPLSSCRRSRTRRCASRPRGSWRATRALTRSSRRPTSRSRSPHAGRISDRRAAVVARRPGIPAGRARSSGAR